MTKTILLTILSCAFLVFLIILLSNTKPPAYDPVKYFDRNGLCRITKIFVDTFAVGTASGYTIDLTPAGFTSIKSCNAIALKNSGTATSVPNVSIKTVTTTSLVLNFIEGNGSLINLLGSNVLLGPSSSFASTTGLLVAVRVEGQ